jgi:multiple antibiotic resistance protein
VNELLQAFIFTFIPLFIVIDPLGSAPLVIAITEGMSQQRRRKTIHLAALTAAAVGLVFLFFGRFILAVLDISVGSFAIAGGIILLVLSVNFMTTGRMTEVTREDIMAAVVPIGTPLTVGPATITALLLLSGQFPLAVVLVAFVANIIITWAIFMLGNQIVSVIGQGGLRVISRVFSLLLAAIAVSMIIQGLELIGVLNAAGAQP